MTGTTLERGEQIGAVCPSCSPEAERVHEVLKPAARATVRCLDCDHVHKTRIESPSTVGIRTVISTGDESESAIVDVPVDEELAVGEEFVAEVNGAPMGVRITSLELETEDRVEIAKAAEVRTIWTRSIDNVAVSATVHPSDGRREGTRSETYYLPGDAELSVGAVVPYSDEEVTIEGLIVRDDAVGYPARKLDRPTDSALAKDVKRLYVRSGRGDTWRSPWT